ncbi:MAG: lipopolysaccharide biosynthesis protein [Planctomycetota bacterium]
MSRVRLYARNVAANYVGFAANVVVAFFLTPFIVHTLGDTRYGIWSLLVSLAGYFGIVDIGVRGSLGRFVNYYLGKDSTRDVNEILSTAVVFFCLCGLSIVAVSGVIGYWLGDIFPKIEPELLPQARIAVLLIGLNMWIGFLSAFPPVILRSQDRFDLATAVQLIGLAIRTGLTVWVLMAGWGLIALGLVQVAMTTVQLAAGYAMAKRLWPPLRIRLGLAGLRRFREVMSFSVYAFVSNASMQLALLSDMLLITWFLGPAQVAYYSVALVLVRHASRLVQMAGGVVVPEVTKQCGRGNMHELQWLFRRAGDLMACIGIGLWVGIFVFGREFMHLWMGPDYDISYWVVAILAVGQVPVIIASLAQPIASGLGYVKTMATVNVLRVLMNVGVTVLFLVLGWGLRGVACGTTVSNIAGILTIVVLVLRWINLSLKTYVEQSVVRWFALGCAFAGMSYLVVLALPRDGWAWFAVKASISLCLYLPMVWWLVLPRSDRERILRKAKVY